MIGFLKFVCLLIGAVSQAFIYADCLTVGKYEKTFCLPLFSTALNLAWSAVLAVSDIFFVHRFRFLTLIGIIWTVQLIFLLRQWLANAPKEPATSVLMKVYLVPWTVIVVASTAAALVFLCVTAGPDPALASSASLIVMANSLLMLKLLDDRRSTRGQSRSVSTGLIVSSCAFSLYGLLRLNLMLAGCGLIGLLFACIYQWALQGYQAVEDHRTVHVYDLLKEMQQKLSHRG